MESTPNNTGDLPIEVTKKREKVRSRLEAKRQKVQQLSSQDTYLVCVGEDGDKLEDLDDGQSQGSKLPTSSLKLGETD
jgi:hypothetical protein